MIGLELIEQAWESLTDCVAVKENNHEMAYAAMCLACPPTKNKGGPEVFFRGKACPVMWPWGETAWQEMSEGDYICRLVKAGALIAAEIGRLRGSRYEQRCNSGNH